MTLLGFLAIIMGIIATGAGCVYLISEKFGDAFDFEDDE